MDAYKALIEQEEAKLALLKQKVKACEQRIAALRSLGEADDIDAAITSMVVGRASDSAPPAEASQVAPAETGEPKIIGLRKDSVAPKVLAFLASGERSLDEIVGELERVGLPRSRDALRTALMNWRKKQGWVTNPQPGRYGLSELGKRAVGVE
ncbi:MAG: hypothetical protein KF903_05775 [Dokdonella sp.]|uniref:hypothetical protein n=1 Tax=Dokdonella sp. TaxID=2291710 RepID=UPI0025B9280A|nr:hypothetical protein [Dokdonella sp.]MBX3700492.1 hypothetical protein [Dokdonella sp.]